MENPIYVFIFWESGGHSPNFRIHVSVSDLYIPRRSVHIFPAEEYADQWWEYINRSQTHEFGNWDCGRAIPFLGIFVSSFRHWFFAVYEEKYGIRGERETGAALYRLLPGSRRGF
jgi:hypothetical protein